MQAQDGNNALTDIIQVKQEGRVKVVVINNPKRRNALPIEGYQAIAAELLAAENDDAISAFLLVGAGEYFCAGGKVDGLGARRALPESQRRELLEIGLHDLIRRMQRSPLPIIAAVEGGAAGAGFAMALAADFLYSDEQARFIVAQVRLGLGPDGGVTRLLAQALPRQLLTELCVAARPIDAQRLHHFGVINQLCPTGIAYDEALAFAQQLAQGPAQAMAGIKQLCHQAYDNDLSAQLDAEARFMAAAQGGAEAAEGIAAFLEKRKAQFHRA